MASGISSPQAAAITAGVGEPPDHAVCAACGADRTVLETVATILAGQLDMDATLAAIASAAQRAVGSDRATCFVHEGFESNMVAVHTTATDPVERAMLERSVGMPLAKMPIGMLLAEQEDQLIVINDIDNEPRIPAKLAARLGSGALLGVRMEHPSITRDGTPALLGTLFMSFRRPQSIPPGPLTAARSLGSLAALAVANARLHASALTSLASAEQRAAIDSLTGLANHRTFHEALRAAVASARRHGQQLSLVLLDLDHFKQVNDSYGHQAGDRALVEVGARLTDIARDGDLVARTGGEEFGWILPDTDADGALAAAERARALIGAEILGVGMLTASAGICDLASTGDPDRLFELADGALYWAKTHGRDLAIRYSPEVVTELSAGERAERLARTHAMSAIRGLARAVDAKDRSTRRHSERVADMAARLATAAGWTAARTARLHEASLLHDVGKIGVPDAVLFKPGRLSAAEYEQVKEHSALGANIAAEVLDADQVAWIRHHHERWDGQGYPDGIGRERVPDGARLLALADAWDCMTTARSYKAPLGMEEAIAECRAQSERQFAPEAVEALERLIADGSLDLSLPALDVGNGSAPLVQEITRAGFATACHQALQELREAMRWDQAFLTRIRGAEIEVIATSGFEIVRNRARLPLRDVFCHRMLAGLAPAAHGSLSDPTSGYADVPARAALGVESYSGHPILLPDGSVFGTLCVLDRSPQEISASARELGDALAHLLAWEAGRSNLETALGRARVRLWDA